MKEYKFETYTSIRMRGGTRFNRVSTVEQELTTIVVERDTINIESKKTGHTKSVMLGETNKQDGSSKHSNIIDIKSLSFRKSKNYMTILKISLGIVIFMFLFGMADYFSQEYLTTRNKLELIGTPFVFGLGFHVIVVFIMILYRTPIKEFAIRFQDNETISFSYYQNDLNQLKELITYIKNINPNIKEFNIEKIITEIVLLGISLLVIFQLSWLGFGYYSDYKYQLKEQELKEALKNDDYYIEEERHYSFKYIKGDAFGYNVYNVNGKYVKIKETDIETYTGWGSGVLLFKIYSKSQGKLLAEKYVELPSDNSISKYGYSYYDYHNGFYKLKEPVGEVAFFDKESRLVSDDDLSIYEFLYSDKETDELGNDNHLEYEHVDSYDSRYGKCYIIKSFETSRGNITYFMYVDIDSDNFKYEGIILKKETDIEDDEENIIKYFKNILPEN